MSHRKLIPVVLVFLLLSGLLIGVLTQKERLVNPPGFHLEELQYSDKGPHLVGKRDLVIDGVSPLEIKIWYPAVSDDNQVKGIAYPYKIKMGEPFGTVKIASSEGWAISDALDDSSQGPYPLVILSPGFSIGVNAYAWLAEHLASYGFVVISPEHKEHLDPESQLWQAAVKRPQDILTLFSYVDEQITSGRTFEGLIDSDHVAVIGHSYGGYTTLAAAGAQIDTASLETHCQIAVEAEDPAAWICEMLVPHIADMAELAGLDSVPEGLWPAWADSRVDAIISMAGDAFFFGQEGLQKINIPVMAIGGTADKDSPMMWATDPTYEYISSSKKVKITLIGAEHMIFTGPCKSVPLYLKFFSGEFCSDTSWNRNTAHALVKHFATAFLLSEFDQDQEALSTLSPIKNRYENIRYEAQGYGD